MRIRWGCVATEVAVDLPLALVRPPPLLRHTFLLRACQSALQGCASAPRTGPHEAAAAAATQGCQNFPRRCGLLVAVGRTRAPCR